MSKSLKPAAKNNQQSLSSLLQMNSGFFSMFLRIMADSFGAIQISLYFDGKLLFDFNMEQEIPDTQPGFKHQYSFNEVEHETVLVNSTFLLPVPKHRMEIWSSLFTSAIRTLRLPGPTKVKDSRLNPCPSIINNLTFYRRFSDSNATVFISGPSGSGKTFLAHFLHMLSRNELPCVELNLSAIPAGLLDLELFGHTQGAFTDATIARPGKLKLAGEGTLILDGIEYLPLDLQAKLQAVLQHKTYYSIGSSEPESFNARLFVLAKNQGKDLVSTGALREDLFYLINVLPITLQPLSERPDDITFFIDEFRTNQESRGRSIPWLDAKYQHYLIENKWPGNIHELLNTLEKARVQGLTDSTLPIADSASKPEDQKDLKASINQYKKKLIHDILIQCNGNQTKAACILGIQRTYLSRLIKELSIPS